MDPGERDIILQLHESEHTHMRTPVAQVASSRRCAGSTWCLALLVALWMSSRVTERNVVTEGGGAGKITQAHQASHQTKEETWRLAGTSMPRARTRTNSFFPHYTEYTLGGWASGSRLEEWEAFGAGWGFEQARSGGG